MQERILPLLLLSYVFSFFFNFYYFFGLSWKLLSRRNLQNNIKTSSSSLCVIKWDWICIRYYTLFSIPFLLLLLFSRFFSHFSSIHILLFFWYTPHHHHHHRQLHLHHEHNRHDDAIFSVLDLFYSFHMLMIVIVMMLNRSECGVEWSCRQEHFPNQ